MNFILYEDEEVFISSYEDVITKLMAKSRINYKIHKIDHYDNIKTMPYLLPPVSISVNIMHTTGNFLKMT